jgi:hypothetical protein
LGPTEKFVILSHVVRFLRVGRQTPDGGRIA